MGLVRALSRIFVALAAPARRPRRVLIYGRNMPLWIAALAPGAPAWRQVEGLDSVQLVRTSLDLLLAGHRGLRPGIVIPLREVNIVRCPRLYWGLLPSRQAVRILANKASFADYVEEQGLSGLTPRTFSDPATATFPCVIKRVDLAGGIGVAVAATAEELRLLLGSAPWRGHPVVLQPQVDGDDTYPTAFAEMAGSSGTGPTATCSNREPRCRPARPYLRCTRSRKHRRRWRCSNASSGRSAMTGRQTSTADALPLAGCGCWRSIRALADRCFVQK